MLHPDSSKWWCSCGSGRRVSRKYGWQAAQVSQLTHCGLAAPRQPVYGGVLVCAGVPHTRLPVFNGPKPRPPGSSSSKVKFVPPSARILPTKCGLYYAVCSGLLALPNGKLWPHGTPHWQQCSRLLVLALQLQYNGGVWIHLVVYLAVLTNQDRPSVPIIQHSNHHSQNGRYDMLLSACASPSH